MHKRYLITVLFWVLPRTGDTFVFMQGNAPVHRACETIQLLQREMLNFIGPDLWPPNSPNLNSVDFKVSGGMQQRVYDNETIVIEVLAGMQQKVNVAVHEWRKWQRVDILNTCCRLREWSEKNAFSLH